MGSGASSSKQKAPGGPQWSPENLLARLPRKQTPEDKERRIKLFAQLDPSDGGSLSLQELYEGCRKHLDLDQYTTRSYDIVKRAFNKSCSAARGVNYGKDDKLEFMQFRLFLSYLWDYYELTYMFDVIDTKGDLVIDEKEFKKAVPTMRKWNVIVSDPDKIFEVLDSDGRGAVTFDEFVVWASTVRLEVVDSDEDS